MTHQKIDYVAIMRAKGCRVTAQRLVILDAVCDVGGHATIGEIHRRVKAVDPTIDQSTVYRNLDILSSIGLIFSAEIGDQGTVYEIAGHTPHHHLVCKVCGGIEQIGSEALEMLAERVRQEYGFVVQPEHLVLSGVCKRCLDAS